MDMQEREPIPAQEKKPERSTETGRLGARLDALVEQGNPEVREHISSLLRLVLEQYPELAHVEIDVITSKQEPETGGVFHRVQIDEKRIVPSISIVAADHAHMERLKKSRRSSAQRAADMLGISFEQLSPELLQLFIVAHEVGHALDYVKNYETNPVYQGVVAAEEWDMHYEANLFSLPVPGFDPVDLRYEIADYETLDAFLLDHPEVKRNIDAGRITTVQDLIDAQEIAYRESAYERYADVFATQFLKQHAETPAIANLFKDQEKEQRHEIRTNAA